MKKEALIDIQLQSIKKTNTIFSFYKKISNYYSKKVFIDKLTEIGIYKGDSSYTLSELELLQTKNLFITIHEEYIDKLNQFIKKYNLNRNLIESNLETLNKIY